MTIDLLLVTGPPKDVTLNLPKCNVHEYYILQTGKQGVKIRQCYPSMATGPQINDFLNWNNEITYSLSLTKKNILIKALDWYCHS